MLSLFWNLSAAVNGYLRFYMPTNRAIDWLRTPRGLKWAIPVALVATPTYLFAVSVCAVIIERGGPGYLNVLVLLFAWNAMKFTSMAALVPILKLVRCVSAVDRGRSCLLPTGTNGRFRGHRRSGELADLVAFGTSRGSSRAKTKGREVCKRRTARSMAQACSSFPCMKHMPGR